jgi:hypothetical protein
MLDEITLPSAFITHVGQKLPHHVQLMVARENLHLLLLSGLRVLLLHDLRVVLQNIREARRGEDALPQVISLDPVRVQRIAGAIVPAFIKRQEPRLLRHAFRAL